MDIDTFARIADELIAGIPPVLLCELSGGISVSPGTRREETDPEGVFILGEYVCDDRLGNQIVLHYGSFCALFDDRALRHELWNTIRHELRQHWERQMGTAHLEPADTAALCRFWGEEP